MIDVLTRELSNSDIVWINTVGQQQTIAADTVLIQEGTTIDMLHIVLSGTLVMSVSQVDDNPLARAFSAIEDRDTTTREIIRLHSGEVIGDLSFSVDRSPVTTTVKAIETSQLISIPRRQLTARLQQDVGFASRFYRAIAILISGRMQTVIRQLGHSKLAKHQSMRDVLLVLTVLNDSDIDWIIAKGQRRQIAVNTVLISQDGPVDALYILLDGIFSASVLNDGRSRLARAFAAIEGNEASGEEITRLLKGEVVGETPFTDGDPPPTTIKALTDSSVLAIPRQQLAIKLQQDAGFAARFYQVIATMLSNRLQRMLKRLGYGRRIYSHGQSLTESTTYDDELDSYTLDQLAIARTRFDWMLKRLKES